MKRALIIMVEILIVSIIWYYAAQFLGAGVLVLGKASNSVINWVTKRKILIFGIPSIIDATIKVLLVNALFYKK